MMMMNQEKEILEAFILRKFGKGSLVVSKIHSLMMGNSLDSLFKTAFKGVNYDEISEAGCKFADALDSMLTDKITCPMETNLPYEIIWPWCRRHHVRLQRAKRMVCEIKGDDAIVTGELCDMDCSGLSV